jgi:hypothetical protein
MDFVTLDLHRKCGLATRADFACYENQLRGCRGHARDDVWRRGSPAGSWGKKIVPLVETFGGFANFSRRHRGRSAYRAP